MPKLSNNPKKQEEFKQRIFEELRNDRDKVKSYFDLIEENGYNYAYVYPGLNKVIQAAGRVIRTENDKGVICFIDIRYNYVLYKETLNETYGEYKNISNVRFINSLAKEFWNK